MRKREFDNVLSLRGADNIKTVIAPSGYARSKLSLRVEQESSTWQTQQNKIIGRDPHVGFSILLRMTILKIGRSLEFFALQKNRDDKFKISARRDDKLKKYMQK